MKNVICIQIKNQEWKYNISLKVIDFGKKTFQRALLHEGKNNQEKKILF